MFDQELPASVPSSNVPTNLSMFDGEVVFIDVETTGLNSAYEYVVEIAALQYQYGKVQTHFCTLVKPPVPIPEEVMRIHHISNEMVETAPVFADVAGRFCSFIEGKVLCGYNVGFDLSFLNQEFARMQHAVLENRSFDVLKMTRALIPHLQRYSLGAVGAALGCRYNELHRAYEDVCLEVQVFEKCLQRMSSAVPVDVRDLIMRFGF